MSKRLNPALRKEQILEAAIELAIKNGYQHVTRDTIASHAGVTYSLVTHYFNTMPQLKRAIMRAAISREIVEIIAQGLASRDPQALKASDELKQRALQSLS